MTAFRRSQGEAEGTRSFIQMLWLHKHHPAEAVHAAVERALVHASPSFALVAAYADAQRMVVSPLPLALPGQLGLPDVHIEVAGPDAYRHLSGGRQS